MQSPLDIIDTEQYWLRSRDVSDSPAIGGGGYYREHDVPRPDEVTAADLPSAETDAIRRIDRDALDQQKFIGKWQVTGTPRRIEDLWPQLLADAESGTLWAVKAMTTYGYEHLPMYDEYLLTVYTPNYFAGHDVDRVRTYLRDEYGIDHELYYKPDIYTAKGIVAETAEEFGLSAPARYIG